ncbi:dihydroneopterin aldolase family protein [Halobacteriota archaeon]
MQSDRERALFELGIKLGALYHQYTGAPINMETLESLERAIEKSVSVQQYVLSAKVLIDRDRVQDKLNKFGYCELDGKMLDVRIEVQYGSAKVAGIIKYDEELDYPLMSVE